MFTSSKSSAAMIQYGDILVLQGITKQKCFNNPEKSEFLLRSDTDNMMVVFPNGQRDVVRVGSGMGPVPQNITMDNLCFVESLSNWHNHISMVPGSPTVSSYLWMIFLAEFASYCLLLHTFSIFNSQSIYQPICPYQLTGPSNLNNNQQNWMCTPRD